MVSLIVRQPAIIALWRAVDPWLCVPAFRQVCLYRIVCVFYFVTFYTKGIRYLLYKSSCISYYYRKNFSRYTTMFHLIPCNLRKTRATL